MSLLQSRLESLYALIQTDIDTILADAVFQKSMPEDIARQVAYEVLKTEKHKQSIARRSQQLGISKHLVQQLVDKLSIHPITDYVLEITP